jgi:MFS family permease
VQGIGAAMLVPGSLSLITAAFSEAERGKAIGTWSGVTAITSAAGPVMGGWLDSACVVAVGLSYQPAHRAGGDRHLVERLIRRQSCRTQQGLDWEGALLASGGLGAITYSLLQISSDGPYVLWIGAAGLDHAGLVWMGGGSITQGHGAA